ncbi:MAG: hypothetical protein PF549_05040, partial [Patescibacteria group bacterium]|nr:hypothetical protein [Patescibacteria group bacterium]
MKNRIYYAIILGAIFMVAGLLFSSSSFAQEISKESTLLTSEKAMEIYPSGITQEQYYAKGENDLGGSFTIDNQEPSFHGDIYYEVSIIGIIDSEKKIDDLGNQVVVYSEFPQDNLVKFKKSTQRDFSFSVPTPTNLKEGKYYFKINLYKTGGEMISSAISKESLNLEANNKFILLSSDNTSNGENFSYTASTTYQEELETNTRVQIRKGNCSDPIVKDIKGDAIKLSNNTSSQSASLGALEDGIYCASLQLEDSQGIPVSNKLTSKFAVGTPPFFVQSINPNQLSYEKGAEATFEILLTNPRPSQEIESPKNFGKLKLTLFNESNKQLSETETEIFVPGVKRNYEIKVPVNENLNKYNLSVELFDKDNNVVDNQVFKSFNDNKNEIEIIHVTGLAEDQKNQADSMKESIVDKSNVGFLLVSLLVFLSVIIILFFLVKKKNRGINMLLVFVLSGMFMAFLSYSAQAACLKTCVTGHTFDRGEDKTPALQGADIYYAEGHPSYPSGYRGTTGADGCFTECGLPAGNYDLDLQAKYDGTFTVTYGGASIDYVFHNSNKVTNFNLSNHFTKRINFKLEAYTGDIKFETTNCDDNSIIPGAQIYYGPDPLATTNTSGIRTVYNIYPGLWHSVYATKTGFIKSDTEEVPVSSNETYWGGNSRLCLKPAVGTATGKVTVCGTSQPVPGASMYVDGNEQTATPTNDSGMYTYGDIAAGTYDNVRFGGVTGFTMSASKSVTISPGATTTTNFCLNPQLGTFSSSWTPTNGEILNNTSPMTYSFYINNNTFDNIDNATVKFLFDGVVVKTQTVSIAPMTNKTVTSQYSIAGKSGSHSIGLQVLWPGTTLAINQSRNITIKNPGFLQGKVKNAKTGTGVSSNINISGKSYSTNADGTFNIPLAIGNYSGVYSSATGYENSVSKSFTITENNTFNQDFLMNREQGSFQAQVFNGTDPVPNARIYLNYPSTNDNDLVGTTNASGWLIVTNIDIGTYDGVYATSPIFTGAGLESPPQTVVINSNTTTEASFYFSAPSVNGSCGTRDTTYSAATPAWPSSSTYCSSGTNTSSPSFPAIDSSVSWTCAGSGGGSDDDCTATRSNISAPSLSFWADPDTITLGKTTTLKYTVSGADDCIASTTSSGAGSWSGPKTAIDNTSINPSYDNPVKPSSSSPLTKTYRLSCSNSGGTTTRYASVTVNPPPASNISPTADITVPATDISGVNAGVPVNFTGEGNDTDGTVASYQWRLSSNCSTGTIITSGFNSTSNLSTDIIPSPSFTTDSNVSFIVTDDVGAVSNCVSRKITLNTSTPAPTVNLTASPPSIELGNSSNISWQLNSMNISDYSCTNGISSTDGDGSWESTPVDS